MFGSRASDTDGAKPVELGVHQRTVLPRDVREVQLAAPLTTAWMNRTNSGGADRSAWPTSSTFLALGTRGDISTASTSGDEVMAAATASMQPGVLLGTTGRLRELEQRLGVVPGDRGIPQCFSPSVAR